MGNWLAGPVAITGASGHVGGFLRRRLAQLPNEIRPVGREEDPESAFADADAVIHLAGTLQPGRSNSYEAANVATVRKTVTALARSAIKRVVLLSYVGADPASANAYLRTKGEAEALVRASERDYVVVRSTFIYGPPENPGPSARPFIAQDGKPVSVIGSGRQHYAPVYVGNVVEALLRAALDSGAPTGTFELQGPDEFAVDDFVAALNGSHVKERHLPHGLARVIALVSPTLSPAMVDVLAADSLAQGPSAVDAFGLELMRLREIYGTAARAPA